MADLQQVRELRDQLPDPSRDEHDQLRERIAAAVTRSERQRRRFSPPRRIWVPAVAAALTIGVVLSVTLLPDDASTPAPANPSDPPVAVLVDAANQLDPDPEATAAVEVPQPDQWRYRKIAHEWVEGPEPDHEEWLRADNGLIADREDGGELTTSDGEGLGISKPIGGSFTSLRDMYTFFQNLPADDPKAVLDRVYAKVDKHDIVPAGIGCQRMRDCKALAATPWARHGAAALYIDNLLYEGTPPPEVQALLYRALAEIPGVKDQGTITDITGKEVLSVGWNPPGSYSPNSNVAIEYRWHTLIDPETSTYRGHLVTNQEAPMREDGLRDSRIILDSGIVNEAGHVPQ